MKKSDNSNSSEQLREAGHKATPGRIAILDTLKKAQKPISISDISKILKDSIDQATLYRALDALMASGIVQKVDLQHSHAHYELVDKENHHHHLICKECGVVEDLNDIDTVDFDKVALKRSKLFDTIKTHSLEFFGICKKCV